MEKQFPNGYLRGSRFVDCHVLGVKPKEGADGKFCQNTVWCEIVWGSSAVVPFLGWSVSYG